MTIEFAPDDKKKEEFITCEELLARVPETDHLGGNYKFKEPHATDLSQVRPIRRTDQEETKEEKKENPV